MHHPMFQVNAICEESFASCTKGTYENLSMNAMLCRDSSVQADSLHRVIDKEFLSRKFISLVLMLLLHM